MQRARGEGYRARSERYPQLNGNLSYVRTISSEFSAVTEDTVVAADPCPAFVPNPAAPIPVRVDSLEAAMVCRDNENIFAGIFGNLPFVRKHFELVLIAIIAISLLPAIIEYLRHRAAARSAARS